jgi:1-deoxy-D-xylulose-5-phosphate synthase
LKINSPDELKRLGAEELRTLSDEIRQKILTTSLKNGGHLGASLGTVELAIALHFVFESPRDAIIWDVGHQAYAHKLLTGRWERFDTLRLENGLSGFLSRSESEHDIFGAGHSSTSLSAALGLARARLSQNIGDWTVAVIGDGGLTAGMAFEAINNLREISTAPLMIVVNDNQMSISKNSGAIPAILASSRAEEFFSLFGCEYTGPIDGHDLEALIATLDGLKKKKPKGPLVVHVITQKGKGYAPAEELPTTFHGVSPLARAIEKTPGAGEVKTEIKTEVKKAKSYSDTMGDYLSALATKDARVVAVTAAMKEGTGLSGFAEMHAERFFDVGIAEPHAVTFSAGLAVGGMRPVACIYSTFLQRALDSVIHDVCLQNLPVIFAIDRAGVVGPDGPTHHGAFDLAYLGAIPGLQISSPSCLTDLDVLLNRALAAGNPVAIRYPRGSDVETLSAPLQGSLRWHALKEKPRLIAVALGPTASRAEKALKNLGAAGEKITLVSTIDAKPISAALLSYIKKYPEATLLTIEDGSIRGGFGEALAGALPSHHGPRVHLGYADVFLPHATPAVLEDSQSLSSVGIEKRMKVLIGEQVTLS